MSSGERVRLGLCAMSKKIMSKPMQAILAILNGNDEFDIIYFTDKVILNDPVASWPIVDCLISFYSRGFPLAKAIEYVRLRSPFLLNDLDIQLELHDRRQVYKKLQDANIPVARHAIFNRDEDTLEEFDDHIVVNGMKFVKPFVEKPADAEDHSIIIYYPRSAGGGSQHLFRKVDNRSSEFRRDVNAVRTTGNYIYEEFLPTEGTDVKVYTVGPNYAHAEARKSPVVDGVVRRDSDGKEVRFPVMLSTVEKDIARNVCLTFKQTVCGFDLLRTAGKSYVCDVNGWSYVKKSKKYYQDCARLLRESFFLGLHRVPLTRSLLPDSAHHHAHHPSVGVALAALTCIGSGATVQPVSLHGGVVVPASSPVDSHRPLSVAYHDEGTDQLRGVIALVRHGDRTPKQKLKMTTRNENFLALFDTYGTPKDPARRNELKLKSARQLQDVLSVTRTLLEREQMEGAADSDHEEQTVHLKQVRTVLERGGHFSGVNRKVQLKPRRWVRFNNHNGSVDTTAENQHAYDSDSDDETLPFSHADASTTTNVMSPAAPVGTRPSSALLAHTSSSAFSSPQRDGDPVLSSAVVSSGASTPGVSQPTTPLRTSDATHFKGDDDKNGATELTMTTTTSRVSEALLVVKWGGELTERGRMQSTALGLDFRRSLYRGTAEVLQLHSSFRHDMKIYSSDEGRVQVTAAAFAKGFLELEGELTPIQVSLVHKDKNAIALLDDASQAESALDAHKSRIHSLMCADTDVIDDAYLHARAPTGDPSLVQALKSIGNPHRALQHIYQLLEKLVISLRFLLTHDPRPHDLSLYNGESLAMMHQRWAKLHADFKPRRRSKSGSTSVNGESVFNLSKIPDIYDCSKYDTLHNNAVLKLVHIPELYEASRRMADVIIPSEYGLTAGDRLQVGRLVCRNLLRKIKEDILVATSTTDELEDETVHRLNKQYMTTDNPTSLGFTDTQIRTRIYFTSESHIHGLLSVLRFNTAAQTSKRYERLRQVLADVAEFDYLTHVVFRVFEDRASGLIGATGGRAATFRVELLFSPGARSDIPDCNCDSSDVLWHPRITLLDDATVDEVVALLNFKD